MERYLIGDKAVPYNGMIEVGKCKRLFFNNHSIILPQFTDIMLLR